MKVIQWGKKGFFNKCCLNTCRYINKKINFSLYLIPYPQINLRWIIDLNVKPKPKLLEKDIGESLHDPVEGK